MTNTEIIHFLEEIKAEQMEKVNEIRNKDNYDHNGELQKITNRITALNNAIEWCEQRGIDAWELKDELRSRIDYEQYEYELLNGSDEE